MPSGGDDSDRSGWGGGSSRSSSSSSSSSSGNRGGTGATSSGAAGDGTRGGSSSSSSSSSSGGRESSSSSRGVGSMDAASGRGSVGQSTSTGYSGGGGFDTGRFGGGVSTGSVAGGRGVSPGAERSGGFAPDLGLSSISAGLNTGRAGGVGTLGVSGGFVNADAVRAENLARDVRDLQMADSITRGITSLSSNILGSLGQTLGPAASFNKADAAISASGLKGNAATIASRLAEKGWNPTQVSGILGRLQQESGFNPNAVRKNDSPKAAPGLRDAVGIAQWNSTRQANLKDFAKQQNKSWTDLEVQVDFLDYELRTSPDERRAFQGLQNAKTPQDAAVAMMHYERPAGYTSKNPTAGHGWNNTLSSANQFSSLLGKGISTAQTSVSSVSQALTSALGPVGVGVQAAIDALAMQAAPQQSQPVGAVAATTALDSPVEQQQQQQDRKGLAGLVEDPSIGNISKTLLGAISNPIGFVMDTIIDGFKNPNLDPMAYAPVDDTNRLGGDSNSWLREQEVAEQVVNQVAAEQAAATADPFPVASLPGSSSNGLFAALLAGMNATGANAAQPVTTPKRKPFAWSTLDG